MTLYATVHYTRVESDTVMVRRAAPWLSWTENDLLAAPEPAQGPL